MSSILPTRRTEEDAPAEALRAPARGGAAVAAPEELDADIARAARAALERRLGPMCEWLEISVHDGVVELGGDLESGNQKDIVEETIGALAGVREVVNHTRIMPPSKLAMRTLYR
ncbi:MAG: BON domain-containing protein [Alphaproteobacteria bacterium]